MHGSLVSGVSGESRSLVAKEQCFGFTRAALHLSAESL